MVVSVLESLRQYLEGLTLSSVIAEVRHWGQASQWCFTRLLSVLQMPTSCKPPLDLLLPAPEG